MVLDLISQVKPTWTGVLLLPLTRTESPGKVLPSVLPLEHGRSDVLSSYKYSNYALDLISRALYMGKALCCVFSLSVMSDSVRPHGQ